MGSGSTQDLPTRAQTRASRSRKPQTSTRRQAASTRAAASKKASRKTRRPQGKKRSIGKIIGLGVVFTFLAAFLAGLGLFLYMYAKAQISQAADVALAQKTVIYYSDGTTQMGDLGEVDRQIIDASTLPDYVGKAVVASEDRSFYTNSGVDPKGILRALYTNITTGSRQGGSTLTQQYVERYYVAETTTSYAGKAQEAILALKINREQSKDEILANYLNTIYFGRRAYGIEAASQAFFGHPAKDLTLSEAAMLAGIIPAPSAWDPAVDPDQAKARWQRVLDLMVEDGWISKAEANAATFPETLDPATLQSSSMAGPVGYLIEQVRMELVNSGVVDEEQIFNGGLQIVSTIDKSRQDAAVAAANTLLDVEGFDPQHQHVALSSMDPETGEIVAEFAGYDYLERQQNAVTQDIAMAGSSFKAFALLANARAGGSIYDRYDGNSPQTFAGLPKPVANNAGTSYGTVDLIMSTKMSLNTSFVALNEDIGPASTMRAAIDAGIPEDTAGLDASLLNVLGFSSPHNIDLTTAYSTIANGGERMTPHIVRKVSDSHGNLLYEAPQTGERVFDVEEVSSIMPALEAATSSSGLAAKASQALPSFKVAGKSGTSEDSLSAQFAGFIPGLVTVVSMYESDDEGNSVPLTPIGGLEGFYGVYWPADVWVAYMTEVTKDMTPRSYDWLVPSTRKGKNAADEPQSEDKDSAQSSDKAPTPAQTVTPVPAETLNPEDTEEGSGTDSGAGSGNTTPEDQGSTAGTGTDSGDDSGATAPAPSGTAG